MNNRLREIRKEKKDTQQNLAKKIGLQQGTIAQFEAGTSIPSKRTINDICKLYNINEEWLEEGKGPRDKEMTEKEKLIARIDEVYNGPDDFHKQALHVLAEMSPEEIKILQIMADRIIAERQNKDKT